MKRTIAYITLIFILGIAGYCFFYDYDHSNDSLYFGGDILSTKDSTDLVSKDLAKIKVIETFVAGNATLNNK
ncbi:MAG: hypothetical protein NWQ46_09225, partial [Spirosomaceae bacterium]|nr:hypothetical protein [Spirosomataceae bacterium]